MNVWFYDIECMINFFSITFKNRDTKELKIFVIHESRDDRNELYNFITQKNLYLIGYNCINYDSQLLEFIIENSYLTNDLCFIENMINVLYQESQNIIQRLFPKYPEWNLSIQHLDLFKIWHFDNRNKATSLKAVEVAMRFRNVQNMPLEHDHYVKNNEVQLILDYNINDVLATEQFYWITKGITDLPLFKGKDKIQLRKNIQSEYNIKCINYNDVKIGDEINKQTYLKLSNRYWKDIKSLNTPRENIIIKDIIANFIQFKSSKFNDILNYLNSKVITNTKNSINKTININNLNISLKQGGLHSQDLPGIFESNDNYQIIDFDVDSFYPSTILLLELYPEHLGKEWLEGYKKIFHQRIYAKKHRKEDKKYETINEALKLSLNGSYGKTGEEKSWQYDPLVTMSVTLNCQLFILMIVEELLSNKFNVISLNTDGCTILCEINKLNELRNIFNNFTLQYKYTFEETLYKKLIRTSVNDYIALKSNNSIKLKGDFEIDKDIHKDPSNRIRAIALAIYFIEGISIEETINNSQNEYKIGSEIFKGYGIFDYVLYVKAKSDQYYNYIEPIDNSFLLKTSLLPKNIRYIISNNGGKIIKIYKKDNSEEVVNSGYKAIIANLIEDNNIKNWDINYQFYIDECMKIINNITAIEVPKYKGKINKKKQDYSQQINLC